MNSCPFITISVIKGNKQRENDTKLLLYFLKVYVIMKNREVRVLVIYFHKTESFAFFFNSKGKGSNRVGKIFCTREYPTNGRSFNWRC